MTPPGMWCWTTAPPSEASSTTTREGRSIRPDYRWRMLSMRSASRSNGTWTREGGLAEQQLGRLADCIDRGWEQARSGRATIREHVKDPEVLAPFPGPAPLS